MQDLLDSIGIFLLGVLFTVLCFVVFRPETTLWQRAIATVFSDMKDRCRGDLIVGKVQNGHLCMLCKGDDVGQSLIGEYLPNKGPCN